MKVVKKEEGTGRINILDIVYFVLLLVIGIVFFVLLDKERGAGFGFMEVIFSLVFAFFVMAFLVWVKSVVMRNPYLGASIGILVLFALGYSFNLRYSGTYSSVFLIGTEIILLIYLGISFFRFREGEKQIPGEFDEG